MTTLQNSLSAYAFLKCSFQPKLFYNSVILREGSTALCFKTGIISQFIHKTKRKVCLLPKSPEIEAFEQSAASVPSLKEEFKSRLLFAR